MYVCLYVRTCASALCNVNTCLKNHPTPVFGVGRQCADEDEATAECEDGDDSPTLAPFFLFSHVAFIVRVVWTGRKELTSAMYRSCGQAALSLFFFHCLWTLSLVSIVKSQGSGLSQGLHVRRLFDKGFTMMLQGGTTLLASSLGLASCLSLW